MVHFVRSPKREIACTSRSAPTGMVLLVILASVCLPARGDGAPIELDQSSQKVPSVQIEASPLKISGNLSPAVKQALDEVLAKHYANAETLTRAIIAKNLTGELPPAYEIQGIAMYLQGETESAILALKKSIELDPKRSSVYTHLGSIDLDDSNLDEAQKSLEQALSLNGTDGLAHQRLGQLLERKGDHEGAIHQYELAAAAVGPQYSEIKAQLGRLYNAQRRFEDTIRLLGPLLSANTGDPSALLVLGTAYLGTADAPNALTVLSGAQARARDNAGVALGLGIAQRANRQFDASVKTLQNAMTLKRDWPAATYQLGLTYLAASKYTEAQTAFADAQTLDPEAASIQEMLGKSLMLGGNPSQAISVFRAMTQRDKASLGDFVLLASAYEEASEWEEAERTYRDAIQRFPKNAAAYLRLGATLASERKYADALNVLDQGSALDPRDARMLRDQAFVQARLGRYYDAIATAQRLVALDPKNASGLFMLATLYQDSGDTKRAIYTYQRTLEAEPNHAFALNNLAAVQTEDDPAAAVPLAQRAVELMPNSAATHDTLGWALLKSGQAPAAVAELRKASELAPNDPRQLYRYAVAQNAANDRPGARETLQKALSMASEIKVAEQAKALLSELSK